MSEERKMNHCCENMELASTLDCNLHQDEFECPDCLIYYSKELKEYGIIIHDGGSSFSAINFCPWCGAQINGSINSEFNQASKMHP